MIRALLSLLILGFLATPTLAAEINDAGAARLKTLFTEILNTQKSALENTGGTLELDGEISLEQADTYYAITLPAITTKDAFGNSHKIGLIAINATPTNNPNNWKMSVALPTPIISYDKDEKPLTRLDIGAQRMGGAWNGALNNFTKIVARYNDLTLSDYNKQQIVNLKQVDITSDFKQSADKTWAGPFQLALSGMNVGTTQIPTILKINDIKLKTMIDGFSPEQHKKTIESLKNTEEENNSPLITTLFKNAGNSISIQGIINGVQAQIPATKIKPASNFSIASSSFNFGTSGLKEGLINQTIQLGYRGYSAPNNNHRYKELFPETLNIDLNLNKLPLEDLIGVADKALPKGKNAKASRQVAALQAMINLPQILAKAGTTLNLSNTSLSNKLYTANFDGALKANPQSIIGATGTLNATVTGLDKTIKMLKKKIVKEKNPSAKAKMGNGLKRLMALKEISKKDGNKSICNVVLNEQAKISINGQDVSGLLELITQ